MSDSPSNASTVEEPAEFPAESSAFLLPGPAGALEVLSDVPKAEDALPGIAIICHPHPLGGGTMHNKVVHIVERSLRELGLRTLRFNFRGVGKSEGEHAEGYGETDDLLAVVNWVQRAEPDEPIWLAGFSFGSYVALRGSQALKPRYMISIAPPVDRYDFTAIDRPNCPWLVVIGSEDDLVPVDAVEDWAKAMDDPPQLVVMPGADHFFHRRLMDLRGVVKNGIARDLPSPHHHDDEDTQEQSDDQNGGEDDY